MKNKLVLINALAWSFCWPPAGLPAQITALPPAASRPQGNSLPADASGKISTAGMPATSQELRSVRDYGAHCDGITDDRIAIQTAINMTRAAGGGTVLIPGNSTCGVSGTIEMRNRVNVMGTNAAQSRIKALSSFPDNSPVIRFAASSGDFNITYSFLSNLAVDCSDKPGCIGVYASSLNELSGLKQILLDSYVKYGVWLDGSDCQNWTLEDLYLGSSAKAVGSIGLFINQTSSSNIVKRITIFSNSPIAQDAGIAQVNSDVVYESVHVESHADGLRFGRNAKAVAMGVFGHSTVANLIHIESTTNSIVLMGLQSGNSPNVIKDDWDSVEIRADSNPYVAFYVIGWAGGSAVLTTAKNSIRNYLPSLDVGSLSSIQTRQAINSVPFSATPIFDLSLGDQDVVLEGNVMSSSLRNLVRGQRVVFRICQNNTGNFNFVWPADARGGMAIGKKPGKCSVQIFQSFDGRTIEALTQGIIDE